MNPEQEEEQAFIQLAAEIANSFSTSQTIESIVPLSSDEEPVDEEPVESQDVITPGPAAIPEPEQELSGMEKILQAFAVIQEGNFFSTEVNKAIDTITDAETMEQVIQLMNENRDLDFRRLLFRRVDEESSKLDDFMYGLQRIPSSPSLDVDFI